MFHLKNKGVKVVLMLLVFIGQVTTASAIPCEMMGEMMEEIEMQDHSTMSDTEPMDHSNHKMATTSPQQESSSSQPDINKTKMQDCCSSDSDCSLSDCSMSSSLTMGLPSFMQETNHFYSSETVAQQLQLDISTFPNSLYRPPILS